MSTAPRMCNNGQRNGWNKHVVAGKNIYLLFTSGGGLVEFKNSNNVRETNNVLRQLIIICHYHSVNVILCQIFEDRLNGVFFSASNGTFTDAWLPIR
jgi:hypothetical protein